MSVYVYPPAALPAGIATEATLDDIATDVSAIAEDVDGIETKLDQIKLLFAGNLLAGVSFDWTGFTPASLTDTFVFKTGGSGGTTTKTIVITYSTEDKDPTLAYTVAAT